MPDKSLAVDEERRAQIRAAFDGISKLSDAAACVATWGVAGAYDYATTEAAIVSIYTAMRAVILEGQKLNA